jgi:hypothetical protein
MARKRLALAVAPSPKPDTTLGAPAPEDAGGQEAAARPPDVSSPEPVELPPSLIEELGRLLGEALAADIRQYPNLAELRSSPA